MKTVEQIRNQIKKRINEYEKTLDDLLPDDEDYCSFQAQINCLKSLLIFIEDD